MQADVVQWALAVVVAAPCVVGGTTTTAFGVTLSGTAAGSFAVGAGVTGGTSIVGNLLAGRDPFSNAPINMIVGGLTNMLGGGTSGWRSIAGNGLGGALEGGFNSWLNGGTGEEILGEAATGGLLNAGLSGLLNKLFKCFAKDTIVWTSSGPKPIGEVKPGERVRAYHFEYGEWVHATVTDRSDHDYKGPVVTVEVGGSKIETTVYHPFWVLEGENLDERAVPKELLPEEDEGKSLKGKWVNSHDLRAGDKIFSLSGKLETIQAVSQRFEESFAVCNLTIDELHNYAVGHCGVLVHNNAGCGDAVAEAVENGTLSVVSALSRLIRGNLDEQHHIFMQGMKKWFMNNYGLDVDKYVATIPKALHDALHAGRGLPGIGKFGWYGTRLMEAIKQREADLGRRLTQDELLDLGRRLAARFGFGDAPWHEYIR